MEVVSRDKSSKTLAMNSFLYERFVAEQYDQAINRFFDQPGVAIMRTLQSRHFSCLLKIMTTSFKGKFAELRQVNLGISPLPGVSELDRDYSFKQFVTYMLALENVLLEKYQQTSSPEDREIPLVALISNVLLPSQKDNVQSLLRLSYQLNG